MKVKALMTWLSVDVQPMLMLKEVCVSIETQTLYP